MKNYKKANLKIIIITFTLFLAGFLQAAENPHKKVKDKLLVINNEISNLTESYVYHYNNVDRLEKEYTEKATIFNTLFESEVESKGEFEKQYDYDKRVNERETELRKQNEKISEIEKRLLESFELANYAYMMHIIKTYEKDIYDSFNHEIKITEKMSGVSSYNSEKESFSVNLKGSVWKVRIPISIAPTFKEEYSNLEIYSFGTDYWVNYKSNWSRLVNSSISEAFEIKISDEEIGSYMNKRSNELKELAKSNGEIESIIMGESILPNPALFLDLSVPYSNTVIIGGKEYKTIRMGNQVWLAENFEYIPSHYNAVSKKNGTVYYNQVGVYKVENLIENGGWHVPSLGEWELLMTYLEEIDGFNKSIYLNFNPIIEYYSNGRKERSSLFWTTTRYISSGLSSSVLGKKGVFTNDDGMGVSEYAIDESKYANIRLVREY